MAAHPAPSRPAVDVGIVTWNTAQLTLEALHRLLDHDQGCDIRVLVHDNASSDDTARSIARAFPQVDVEAGTDNIGFARAVNRLMARGRSPWFLALNSDAWPEPGAIGTLVARAEALPRAAAVAPLLRAPDGTIEHSTHPFPSPWLAALDVLGGRRWLPRRLLEQWSLQGGWRHDRPRRVAWAVGAALLLRRAAVEDIGGFDERFFMYVEDLEWCWRARRRGWEVHFEPTAVVRHIRNVSGAVRFGQRRAALEAANLRVVLEEQWSPGKVRTYKALTVAADLEQLLLSRAGGRKAATRHWRRQTLADLGWELPPPTGPVGRPAPAVTGPDHPADGPLVSVAVSTHGRSQLLPRLVAALEAQTLPPERFEVVIVDNASPDDTSAVLDKLASATSIQLRALRAEGPGGPARGRNMAWRAARGAVVAFTDDDCLPCPAWLEEGLAAFDDGAGVVVGRTTPPPEQRGAAEVPFARVVQVDDVRFFETCNVFYRRADLEAVDGFDESFRGVGGEDTDLGLRLTERGVAAEFAPGALVHHEVRPGSFAAALRESLRWSDLPLVIRRHPAAGRRLAHRFVFWRAAHPPALAAAVGILLGLRWRPALLLVVPWVRHRTRVHPLSPKQLANLKALPGALVIDICEVGVMARGAIRHRTLFL